MGGTAAQAVVHKYPSDFEGLIFNGVYPTERYDLKDWNRNVLSLYAEFDGLSTVEEIAKLKIGDTFVMEHAKDKDIIVRSGPIPLFTGKIGKVDNKVAINLKNLFEG